MDYREVKDQWEQARLAGKSRNMVVAGPLSLVQGGTGLIGRAPVIVRDRESGEDTFWGLVSAVIEADDLFKRTIGSAEEDGIEIALRGLNATGNQGAAFYGRDALFHSDAGAITIPVTLPSGSWMMAALPKDGWTSGTISSAWVHGFFIVAMLSGIIGVWFFLKGTAKLRSLQVRLSNAQRIAGFGNWEYDILKDSFWFSERAIAFFGDTEADTPKNRNDYINRVFPEDREEVAATFSRAMREKHEFELDHRILDNQNNILFVLSRGERTMDGEKNSHKILGTILDITERKKTEGLIKEQKEQLKAMSEASYDALIMIDSKGRTILWNPAAERIFGYRADEIIGEKVHQLIALDDDFKKSEEGMPRFARTGKGEVLGSVMEFTAKDKWGRTFPIERSVSSFQVSGRWYAVGIIRDITNRKQMEEKLRRLATTDTLTELPNRRHFLECLESDLNQAKRYERPFSLIMLDIDHFKSVNDTYGHDAGDEVLKTFATICLKALRQTDTPGRLGGEEFAVALPETDREAAVILAERLRKNIESTRIGLPGGEEITITASIGVVSLLGEDNTADSLIKRADEALYRAKRKGRNRVEIGNGHI